MNPSHLHDGWWLVPLQVFCRQPQLLCVHGHIIPVVSIRHCFIPVLSGLWLLQSFDTLFCDGPLSIGGMKCDLAVSFVAERATDTYFLLSDQLWVSSLTPFSLAMEIIRVWSIMLKNEGPRNILLCTNSSDKSAKTLEFSQEKISKGRKTISDFHVMETGSL